MVAGQVWTMISMRSGQSCTEMSQKRHSPADGTRAGGVSLASRRMSDPSCSMNWRGRSPWGTGTMWSG